LYNNLPSNVYSHCKSTRYNGGTSYLLCQAVADVYGTRLVKVDARDVGTPGYVEAERAPRIPDPTSINCGP